MSGDDWIGYLLFGFVGCAVIYAAVIDPIRRIRARKARARGEPHDAELVKAAPELPDPGGTNQAGAVGCLLMLGIPLSFMLVVEPFNFLASGACVVMLILWLIAAAGPSEPDAG